MIPCSPAAPACRVDAAASVEPSPAAPTMAAITVSISLAARDRLERRIANGHRCRNAGTRRPASSARGRPCVLEHGNERTMADALLEQPLVIAGRRERHDREPVGMALRRRRASTPMLPVEPKTARRCITARVPALCRPSRNTGPAAVRLSMRSSTPPCPGNRLPLSLRPARRLNMLSTRSPITETKATARQSTSHFAHGIANSTAPPTAMTAAASSPLTRPSQVLPGLTNGASLRRPKRRPPKYAPTSAAATSTTRNNSSSRPWGSISTRWASATAAGASTKNPASSAARVPPRRGPSQSQSVAASHQAEVHHSSCAQAAGRLREAPENRERRSDGHDIHRALDLRRLAGESRPFPGRREEHARDHRQRDRRCQQHQHADHDRGEQHRGDDALPKRTSHCPPGAA